MAFFIDSLIQGVCYFALFLLAALVIAVFPAPKGLENIGPKWAVAIIIISGFLVYAGYFAIFETWWHGQTPGKKYVGIRVVKDTGRGITGGEAMSRNFLRIVDGFPAFYLFGLIVMLVNKEKKRVGDYVAGTLVVHEKVADEKEVSFQPLQENTVVQDWSTRLTAQDLELIESFLQRRYTLEPGARYVTGSRIAEHLTKKSGVTPETGEAHEDFLQRVATGIRNSRRV